jgi:hypothetical protein
MCHGMPMGDSPFPRKESCNNWYRGVDVMQWQFHVNSGMLDPVGELIDVWYIQAK